MKQKVGIIAAFMHDPQVIILDEPTSGLDPLMQNLFMELVLSENVKAKECTATICYIDYNIKLNLVFSWPKKLTGFTKCVIIVCTYIIQAKQRR